VCVLAVLLVCNCVWGCSGCLCNIVCVEAVITGLLLCLASVFINLVFCVLGQ